MNLLRRLRLFLYPPEKRFVRPGRFWCDEHWSQLMDMQYEKDAPDPHLATVGLAIGLQTAKLPVQPTQEACCMFTQDTLKGVLDRSRPSWGRPSAN